MMRTKTLSLIMAGGLLALGLSGCGDQKATDAKLAKGCEAAVKTVLDKEKYSRQLGSVKSSSFDMSEGFRLVKLAVTTKDKQYETSADETFNCKFQVDTSFLGLSWKAYLVQVKVDEDIYGSEGGQIYGDMNDQMNLDDAVQDAMK